MKFTLDTMDGLLYSVSLDASTLVQAHPPRFRHPHKRALFAAAYPDKHGGSGTIDVTRWSGKVHEPINLLPIEIELRPDFFDYQPLAGRASAAEWHVNFADPDLFVAYGSGLFAQDEMQAVEHPQLGCVREALLARGLSVATDDQTGPTPILVRNVQRRLAVSTAPAPGRPGGLYGNRFAAAPIATVLAATRLIDPPTASNLIAIAAPVGSGDYTESQIDSIFTAAYTGFAAAGRQSTQRPVVVHSGFWGCGAFGGNRKLMIAMQTLAGRAAGVGVLVFHTGDVPGVEDARAGLDLADRLASRCGTNFSLDKLVGRAAILGMRWGVSDGN